MATFAQRVTGCEDLQRKTDKGLTCIPLADRDAILIKDPSYIQPGSSAVVVWREWALNDALTAYGLPTV